MLVLLENGYRFLLLQLFAIINVDSWIVSIITYLGMITAFLIIELCPNCVIVQSEAVGYSVFSHFSTHIYAN